MTFKPHSDRASMPRACPGSFFWFDLANGVTALSNRLLRSKPILPCLSSLPPVLGTYFGSTSPTAYFRSQIACSAASTFLLAFLHFFLSAVVTLVQPRRRLTFAPTANSTRRRAQERSRSAVARTSPRTQVSPGCTLTASSTSADWGDWAEGLLRCCLLVTCFERVTIALPSTPLSSQSNVSPHHGLRIGSAPQVASCPARLRHDGPSRQGRRFTAKQ
jgi:hypothetical protein